MKSHRLLTCLLAFQLFNLLARSESTLPLSALKQWPLSVVKDSIPSEQFAAIEFQRLYQLITGTQLQIAPYDASSEKVILIGSMPSHLTLDQETLRIDFTENSLHISGGRPRGTLYGVYEFFERYAGVRFLTHDHTYVPADVAARTLPFETYTYSPPFSYRNSYYRENFLHPEFTVRLRLNTFASDDMYGGITDQNLINHSFHQQIPVELYGEDHPEYFALMDGKRRLTDGGGGPEPCVSNPDVIDIVTAAVIKSLDANPRQRNISVSQNDNDKYCHCENCEAINQREGTPMGSQLYLVNEVARRVEDKHPDVKIGTLSYWYTRRPPKTMKPRDNIQIQLCSIECCTLHPIDDPNCEKNRSFCEDLAVWKTLCQDIWIWNYNVNFGAYDRPFPNLKSIGANVRYFRDNNTKGVFMQGAYNGASGELSDLRNYVISRCLWKPELDSWEQSMEFCRLHYGEAASPIIKAITLIHDNAEASGVHPGCFPQPKDVGLTPEIAAQLMQLYSQALTLASELPIIRDRVEKASICAYRAMLDQDSPMKRDGNTFVAFTQNERHQLVNYYTALCKRHQLTHPGEHYTLEAFLEKISE